MAWVKALHVVALLVWCAGLLYLPGLFASARSVAGRHVGRLHMMTRFTFVAVASPAAVLAIVSGSALAADGGAREAWLLAKLAAVTGMVLFHLYCGRVVTLLDTSPRLGPRRYSAWLAAVPAALILAVLWLVLAKPF